MVWDTVRDALDILKRARGVGEVLKAVVPGLGPPIVLNEGEPAEPIEATALIRALRGAQRGLEAHLHEGKVDYAALRRTDAFSELAALAPSLRCVTPRSVRTDAERVAFFINLYNVLSIHGVLALDIEGSVMEVPSFFGRVSYRVGDAVISLDAMENGVLRRNAGHPATGRRTLAPDDPALAYCPSQVDPRIHASLVCASTSCPPVAFYDPERLDAQLDLASAAYVNGEVRVVDDEVRLPISFRYYAVDWGGREGIEAYLSRYADPPLAGALTAAFERGARFTYERYDWSLNLG